MVPFTTKSGKKIVLPIERNMQQCMRGVETRAASPKRGACPVPRSCWPSRLAWIEHSGLARVLWICWSQGWWVWCARALLAARLARAFAENSCRLQCWRAGRKVGVLVGWLARGRRGGSRAPLFSPAGNTWLEMAAQAASAPTMVFGLRRPMVFSRWKVSKTIPFSIWKGCGGLEAASQGIKAPSPWPKLAATSGFPSPAHRAQVVTPRGWRLHVITR